jgi:type VI secretion system protein ImpG
MAVDVEEALLNRYRDELTWFRRMGGRFAKQFPRVAKRLELDNGPSADPHVERLIESVAFLTAKLQNHLEGELPEITSGLLGYLYPHFTQPVPSMAIAEIVPDDGGAGLTTGVEMPAGTRLYQQTTFQRRTCWFRTCYPVTLWPVEITEAKFEAPGAYGFMTGRDYLGVRQVLRLRIKTKSEPLHLLAPDTLRIYLDGDDAVVGGLYEMLLSHTKGVACVPVDRPAGRGHTPPEATVHPVGFASDEIILPTQEHALEGFSLLQEYFGFPQKFMFFDIKGIVTDGASDEMDLLFMFDQAPRRRISIRPETFRLGCTPVINLFEKVSEPIQITGKSFEYLLQPDSREERVTEVHTIKAITPSLTLSNDDPVIEPLYGGRHHAHPETVYWRASRRPCRNPSMPGTDIYLSFLDMRLEPALPEEETYRAHLWCTNRDLPTFLDRGESLNIEDGPHAKVTLMTRPTPQITPPLQGESLWRLISLLALSHTGLPHDEIATVEALREKLRVYGFTSAESIEPQLQAMTKVSRETVAMRADDNAWRGFVRVQRITIEVDEERFDGPTALLLGQVLDTYFSMHASINVFTQLVMLSRQREGTWKRWPPNIPTTKR